MYDKPTMNMCEGKSSLWNQSHKLILQRLKSQLLSFLLFFIKFESYFKIIPEYVNNMHYVLYSITLLTTILDVSTFYLMVTVMWHILNS